ncbi:FAD/NAD(P)-binding domain-containing protein [Xylaria arbuscula]|nr:FAD/NAD(P)-binding domain-containing protein [Xylaria arbuscula]
MVAVGKPPRSVPRQIAIIGGGISGIACAWGLQNQDDLVDIYEADDRLGGHANSVPFNGNGRMVNVDTGFIAIDETTYPQFSNFLRRLGVHTIPTDMSFGLTACNGAIQWGSYSIWSFVGCLSNLFSPWFWRIAFDALRFSLFAHEIMNEDLGPSVPDHTNNMNTAEGTAGDVLIDKMRTNTGRQKVEPIGDYLRRKGYSRQFITYYLIPMTAAPWCIDPDEFEKNFPALALIRFMMSHGLLNTVTRSLNWRSFCNGSKTYVDAFQRQMPAHHKLHLKTPIRQVIRVGDRVAIEFLDYSRRTYDHVVLAIHANQALTLLGEGATAMEHEILSAFQTRKNICYLHSDTMLLPRRESARVAWNCFLSRSHDFPDQKLPRIAPQPSISLTFDMNKLQRIPFPGEPDSPGRVLVSMNPLRTPHQPQSVHIYHHPLINTESISMVDSLHMINGVAHISFAGAWMGFGFHEDGFAAGSHVASLLINGAKKTKPLNLMGRGREAHVTNAGILVSLAKLIVGMLQHLVLFLERNITK